MNMRYKLSSIKLDGYLLLTYKEGRLNSLTIEFKQPLTFDKWLKLTNIISPDLNQVNEAAFIKAGLAIVVLPDEGEDAPIKGNERIALFCEFFEKQTGIKYKVSRAAGAKMRDLPVSGNEFAICLKAYFDCTEWWSTPKSIENFCGKINEIRQLISSPAIKKQSTKFPIPYDPEYAKLLPIGKLMEYQKVLRDADYTFVAAPGRSSGNWVLKSTLKNK